MRAARIVAPRRLELFDTPLPEPSARSVRFRVEGCGVAASPEWTGSDPAARYPVAPAGASGEAWGVVDAVGSEVRELKLGDRIASLAGQGFAEYDVVDSRAALVLPIQLSGVPFCAAPLAGAMDVFERSRIVAGQVVAIVGIGFLGAILVQLAAFAGARVIALSRRPFSLTIAREMGAVSLVPIGNMQSAVDEVAQQTSGRFCGTVIEATGAADALTLASRLTGARGTLVIAGRHQAGREVDVALWQERGITVVAVNESASTARASAAKIAVSAMLAGELDLGGLYTDTYSLAGLGEALEQADRRPIGFVKAWVKPRLRDASTRLLALRVDER
jgi:threonine dehydrogenase-like Zn-dependent dehydrogenase